MRVIYTIVFKQTKLNVTGTYCQMEDPYHCSVNDSLLVPTIQYMCGFAPPRM